MILEPGTFRVSDYRTTIPTWVQIKCVLAGVASGRLPVTVDPKELRMDHRPPLQDRAYNTETEDFVPPQNDPEFIQAILAKDHDQRTFGTKATTAGSDIHRRAHTRRISNRQQLHEVKMAAKSGDPEALAKLLGCEKEKRPKRKMQSRGFPKRQKPLRQSA